MRNIPLEFEMWLKFDSVTSFHVGSDTMLRNQLNQKLILMVEAPGYVIYSNSVSKLTSQLFDYDRSQVMVMFGKN